MSMKHFVVVVAHVVVVSFFIVETLAKDMVCVDGPSGQCQHVASSHSQSDDELPWSSAVLYSMLGSFAVGLTGVIPLIWIPSSEEKRKENGLFMGRALSFAAGALLGDVFLHILPESWNVAFENHKDFRQHTICNGVLILVGIISFLMLEKILSYSEINEAESIGNAETANINGNNNINREAGEDIVNGDAAMNGRVPNPNDVNQKQQGGNRINPAAYLNLFANCLDNFTHGLAIGGSFLVNFKFGLMTTGAILLHEIPHEFGDFAILLRSGLERWKAAQLQIATASGGLFGAIFAHIIDAKSVWWILPFTAGGFLHISLCTIIPDLMKDTTSKRESIIQLCILISAVCIMGMFGFFE